MTADTLRQLERELTRAENELAAQRKAYEVLLRVATDKLQLLDMAERDQYLAALRRVEKLADQCDYLGTTATSDELRSCYADVPGVAE